MILLDFYIPEQVYITPNIIKKIKKSFLIILVNMGILIMPLCYMWKYNKIKFAIITFIIKIRTNFSLFDYNKNNKVGLMNLLLVKLI